MIRKAAEQDLEAVAGIYDRLTDLEETGTGYTGWKKHIYPTIETARSAYEKNELFVMEVDGCVTAAAKINQEQVPEYANCQWQYEVPEDEVMVLHTLVIDPQYSGRGCATEFVKFYEAYALEHGCHYLRIDTNEINTPARKLYRKLKFTERGIVPCVFNGIEGVRLVCLEKKCGEVPEV
ncbi:MAG: GNAT family N-acetyltransferase [Lachnospiraceae bacterium]|nr:GNAT family N-acetyltransferase [Lachnospiraceae bacterium]